MSTGRTDHFSRRASHRVRRLGAAVTSGPDVGGISMPTKDIDMQREAIRRTLAYHAGDIADASAIAEATLIIWHQMASRLLPVVGARGVDVLLDRSLYLTGNVSPLLANSVDQGDRVAVLANIKTRLAGSQTNTAAEASYALFTTFSELLISLIGEPLTERLVGPVWSPPLPATEKKIKSWTTK